MISIRVSRACVAAMLLVAIEAVVAQPLPVGNRGFPNVPQNPGMLLSGLNAPQQGRTAILAYHGGVLFTVPEEPSSQAGSDFEVRLWDISNPTVPVELAQIGRTPMPVNAHGYIQSGEYLVLGPNFPPTSPWSFRAMPNGGTLTRTTFPGFLGMSDRGHTFAPWFAGPTYRLYFPSDANAEIRLRGQVLSRFDHLGLTGVIGHPFLLGNLLIYAAEESRTGVATYDLSNPANPVLLDLLRVGGPGGYWPELWAGNGRLYIVFPYRLDGNGFRVVDATDPTDLQFVADRPLAGATAQYAQFQDEFGFIGDHKIDMRTFDSVLFFDGANVQRTNGPGVGVDTSQFALPLGNLLVTGGIGPNQGMAIWAHQAAPDTRGPSVAYHIPRAGQTGYPIGAPISLLIHETLDSTTLVAGTTFIVRPLNGAPIAGDLVVAFDDIVTFTPAQPLAADTTYEVLLPAGGIRDAVGNGMVEHRYTFSTGSTLGGNAPPDVTSVDAAMHPARPGQAVALAIVASDPESGPLEYRFDFGDGTPTTAWSASDTLSHAYATQGHYSVTAQVRDSVGSIASGATRIAVVPVIAGPRPTQSAPIVCDAPGRRVHAIDRDNGRLATLDADTLATLREAGVCETPRALALGASNELWLACERDDAVVVVDAASYAERARIATGYGSAPVSVASNPAGTVLYVALAGRREIVEYAASTRTETGRVAVAAEPRALAVSGNGTSVFATRFLSAPDDAQVYRLATGPLRTNGTATVPSFGGEENTDTPASGRGVANHLAGIALSPLDGMAWVAANKPNTARGRLVAPNADLGDDSTVRNLVMGLDPATLALGRAVDLDNSDSASAAVYSPDGDYLLVALQGNDELAVLDALSLASQVGTGSVVGRVPVGAAPQGLCVDAPTGRTFVANFTGRSVTMLESRPLFERGVLTLVRQELRPFTNERLAVDVLAGKRIFYFAGDLRMSAEGYLSCATCHLDGGNDGRTWDFTGRGEGLRNTADLRGRAGLGHGNVHWSANFDEIQDFENDIRSAFGGRGFLSDADYALTQNPLGPPKAGRSAPLDALARFVESLDAESLPRSPHRASDGSATAAAERGRTQFTQLGCGSCHAGTAFTDSTIGAGSLRDVGTLRTTSGGRLGGPLAGIDTPTLHGLFASAPYLHDGSAARLEDVFTALGGRIHAAESGTARNGAARVDQFTTSNHDDTPRARAFVAFSTVGAALDLTAVEGGNGGTGAVELRYSSAAAGSVEVIINGAPRTLALASTGNAPAFRRTRWRTARLENVPLNAGATNAVTIRVASGPGMQLGLDEITVATAGEVARAGPHRAAASLAPAARDDLVAYLNSLDGAEARDVLFRSGFE